MYRMDSRACEDWSGVIGGAPKKKAAVPLQITDKLKNEYVGAVLKDGNCYSVLETSPEAGAMAKKDKRNLTSVLSKVLPPSVDPNLWARILMTRTCC